MDVEYQTLRTFADSWGLLYMMAIFLAVLVITLRPGSRQSASDAADIPFKED
ncbi:cbb3-type cytochrome c oxidase subunit 3 [Fulvimarina sp. MAC3]|uniref:cbb3-type cytochrome c oxidase subunit 3 n=1 Tax=Fulvimarina sp. MAC3 TaxID=3148887 RepID=UPI0031FCFF61